MKRTKYSFSRRTIVRNLRKLTSELTLISTQGQRQRVNTKIIPAINDVITGLECLGEELQQRYIYDTPKHLKKKKL